MSVEIQGIDERRLRLGVFKIAIGVAIIILIVAFIASMLADKGQGIVVTALLTALAFALFANGFLALLKVIESFETRRNRRVAGTVSRH